MHRSRVGVWKPALHRSLLSSRASPALGSPPFPTSPPGGWGASAFCGDWLLGALQPAHAVLALLDRPTYLRTYRQLLRNLLVRQLMLGQSAVVDCVVDDTTLTDWRTEIESREGALCVVECVCPDESLHRQRVEGRTRDIPG
jgi:hypothetical protein